MKNSKQMFIDGFWTGFEGGSCVFGTDGSYCQGFIEGAKLTGLMTEDDLINMLTEIW